MDDLYHSHDIERELAGCCLDCQRSYRCIYRHLMHFSGQIRGLAMSEIESLSHERLFALFEELDDIAHLEVSDHLSEAIFRTPAICDILPAVRDYYSRFFCLHEQHAAREICASASPRDAFRSYPLYDRYLRLVSREMRGLGLGEGSRIAFLGSGSLPISLILISSLFSCRCTGIDIDGRAVAASQQVLDCLGLDDRIRILHGDERALADAEWDAVLVAALAEPKQRIFQTLAEIIDERGDAPPVAVRTYTGMRALLYTPMSENDLRGFHCLAIIPPVDRVNNTTLILERMP
jgi:hypothetical protein